MRTLCALLAILLLSGPLRAEIPVPPVEGHVVDLAGLLPADRARELELRLSAFEREKGSQIILLTVPTTDGEPIEQFGIRVAEARKAGRQGVDDGAFLLVASADRRMRIEVGYGLEGALNDATCKRIIDEIVTPRFRDGDYAGGIEEGLSAMMTVVSGEELPPPERVADGALGEETGALGFVALVTVILSQGLAILVGRLAAALLAASAVLFFGLTIAPAPLAIVVAVVIFFVLLVPPSAWSAGAGRGRHGGGIYTGGSSRRSGGGFRLGGGGFGGGGASGSW